MGCGLCIDGAWVKACVGYGMDKTVVAVVRSVNWVMKRPRSSEDVAEDVDWPYGDRFMVFYPSTQCWYLGKIASVNAKDRKIRIRYAGWGEDDDEWIEVNSDR